MQPNPRPNFPRDLHPDVAELFNPMPRDLPQELADLIELHDPDIEFIADSIERLRYAGLNVEDPDIFHLGIRGGRARAERHAAQADLTPSEIAARRAALEVTVAQQTERAELRCVVYYMRIGNRVKIGYTGNLRQRLSSFTPEELMATEPGGPKREGERHKQFAHLRTTGEWFRLEGDLVDHIQQLASKSA
jgi:Meiotically up-regulated gene 113